MTNYDKELIAKIEKYFLDIEKDISELLHDNQVTKTKLLKLDKIEGDVKRLSLEVENVKQNTLSLPAFDSMVDGFLNRMEDLREIRQLVKRHESRFDVYDDKFDGIFSQLEGIRDRLIRLESDVTILKTDVAELKETVKNGFELMNQNFERVFTEIQKLQK